MPVSGLAANDPVKLRGFVAPFGHAADEPDFEAQTVVDISQVEGLLFATWWPAASDFVQNLSDGNSILSTNIAVIWLN